MNTTKHERHGTVAGQVDCRVRPLDWPLRYEWQQHTDKLPYCVDRRALGNQLHGAGLPDAKIAAGYCLDAPEDIPAGSVEAVSWIGVTAGARASTVRRVPLLWRPNA